LLDLSPPESFFDPQALADRPATLWRYLEALPFESDGAWRGVTMGEGFTPLVDIDPPRRSLKAKVDFLMPTLSFKDRGAVILVALAVELGTSRLVVDSAGNAGAAVAAYAARAGLACEVYAPTTTSPKKLSQVERHGASVIRVNGPRQAAADAAIQRVDQGGGFYASHVYNPFFYEGTKTFAFEVWEQLGRRAPERLVLPVGNGTLVLGAFLGFSQLRDFGLIDVLPQIVAVQSERCAPIAAAFSNEADEVIPVEPVTTAAEGIAITAPPRGAQVLDAIRQTGGAVITAAEDEIEPARTALAHRGFFVEPSTAVTYVGLRGLPEDDALTVTVLCGAGLKAG
jgi:threonine synthase